MHSEHRNRFSKNHEMQNDVSYVVAGKIIENHPRNQILLTRLPLLRNPIDLLTTKFDERLFGSPL